MFFVNVMEAFEVGTKAFKPHCIHGAAAAYLLHLGAPKPLAQAHALWSSGQTLDNY